MNGFYVLSGGWAIITLALFVYAITLSYRVEKRSRPAGAHPGLPRFADVIGVAFNKPSIARDAQTQGLRRRMVGVMLVVLALMGGFAILVNQMAPGASA